LQVTVVGERGVGGLRAHLAARHGEVGAQDEGQFVFFGGGCEGGEGGVGGVFGV